MWTRRGLLAGLLVAVCAPSAWAAGVDPAQLKAVFLVRFLRYVDFGGEPLTGLDALVVGAPEVAIALREVGAKLGEVTVRDHTWELLPEEGLDGVKVVFLRGEVDQARTLIEGLPEGVLVVGDDPALLEAGAALAFFWDQDRLRFGADQDMAKARGVRLGSEILRLSKGGRP